MKYLLKATPPLYTYPTVNPRSPLVATSPSSGAKVKNFLGADCASCHVGAQRNFDFVCEKSHGCAPLGVSDSLIATIQKGDPRPKH